MIKNSLLFICILLYSFNNLQSQSTELARIEYTYIPQANSANVYNRFRATANYPIRINNKGTYLIITGTYKLNRLELEEELIDDDKERLDSFQTIGLELGYTFKMKNDWRFGTNFGFKISSDFEGVGVGRDDFRYTGSVYFIKSYKNMETPKIARFVIGVKYTTPASLNFPLPIINYFKRFHIDWSYAIGTPKSNIKYFLNKKSRIETFVSLDRFYSNLQNNKTFFNKGEATIVAKNVSMFTVMGGLGYEHYFTEHLLLYAYMGYTLSNEIRLRNSNQEDVVTINDSNTLYFRSGIKFKI
ncbi:DUF6268 family outer membrane beta-barrel protein [Aquimarina longa]|uniref:DUF6268 family outer membrane beta-barrel protein n=1 Tax=Aquimarina longa TaxID=1080221 RepID=UPI000782F2E8|nr:DUF6268 family outer membrane beta-barrel protein [Aquimarina longa]